MDGITFLLLGIVRQTLTFIFRETAVDELNPCLKILNFGHICNMRVRLHGDLNVGKFVAMLIRMGNGYISLDTEGAISFPQGIKVQVEHWMISSKKVM